MYYFLTLLNHSKMSILSTISSLAYKSVSNLTTIGTALKGSAVNLTEKSVEIGGKAFTNFQKSAALQKTAQITKEAASYAVKHPIQTAKTGAIVTTGSIFTYGYLSEADKPVQTAVNLATDSTKLVSELGKSAGSHDISRAKDAVVGFVKEHPFATGAAAGVGTFILGKAGVNAYSSFKAGQNVDQLADEVKELRKQQQERAKEAIIGQNKIVPSAPIIATPNSEPVIPNAAIKADEPITPARSVVGRSASSTSIRKYKRKTIQKVPNNTVRVNIFNQSRLNNAKYIKN